MIETFAKIIEFPVDDWPGNCFGVASGIAEAIDWPGRVVYGLWWGTIHEDSHFNQRVCSHGWMQWGEWVVDPTRWVFESKDPYVYEGPVGPEYDEGGRKLHEVLADKIGPPDPSDGRTIEEEVPEEIRAMLRTYVEFPDKPTTAQLGWVASRDFRVLGKFAKPFFEWLVSNERQVLIPIDSRKRVLEHGIT